MSQELLSEQAAMYILTAVGICFLLLFFVSIIEQQTTRYGWIYKPSTILSQTAQKCQSVFSYCGKSFAQICSFLIQIKDFAFEYLKDLIPYFLAVFVPLTDLLSSPLYILKGYADQCWKYIYGAEQPPRPEEEEVKRAGRRKKPTEPPETTAIYVEDNCTNFVLLGLGTLVVIVSMVGVYTAIKSNFFSTF